MKRKPIEDISRALDEIDVCIKRLESSQNSTFVLIENETLNSFHWFNLCLKLFWDEFDKDSFSHLLQYQIIVKKYSELRKKYITLFREQIYYLDKVLDLNRTDLKDLAPFIFSDDDEQKVIGYYNQFLKDCKDKVGKPLYIIEEDNNPNVKFVDENGEKKRFFVLHSDKLNFDHYRSLESMRNCLKYIYDLMDVVCSYPNECFFKYSPSQEEIINALEKELRQYAKEVGKDVERDLKKITQELKPSRSAPLTPEVWGKLMEREDDMFDQAIYTQVGEIEDKYLENISTTKNELIDNYSLLEKIKSTCIDDELFDVRLSVETHQLLTSLNVDNLDLFKELVLRRNIIHREMFPDELRAKYEEWINTPEEQQSEDVEETGLDAARQSKLDDIIGILKNGNWKEPATVENVEQLLNTVFGKDKSLLDDGDEALCENMWSLVENGRGDRMVIIPANIAGFFSEENLLIGSPKEISDELFGKNNNQSNSINDGKKKNRSNSFEEVIPFINKYIDKIIRQG